MNAAPLTVNCEMFALGDPVATFVITTARVLELPVGSGANDKLVGAAESVADPAGPPEFCCDPPLDTPEQPISPNRDANAKALTTVRARDPSMFVTSSILGAALKLV